MSLDTVFDKTNTQSSTVKRYVFIAILLIIGISWLGVFDDLSTAYLNGAIFDASIAFASARLLNAIISTLQSTTLDFQIFSVGVGEALDPLNDLVEQYSSMMMLAIGSLVIQKLLLEIISALVFKVLLTLSGVMLLYAWLSGRHALTKLAMKLFVSLVFLRFLLVAVVLLNSVVDKIFVEPQIEQDLAVIENFPSEMERLQQQNTVSLELRQQLESEIQRLEIERLDITGLSRPLEEKVLVLEAELETLQAELNDVESQLSTTQRYNVFNRNEAVQLLRQQISEKSDELRLQQKQRKAFEDKVEALDVNIIAAQKSLAGESSGILSGISNRISSLTQSLGEIRDKFSPSAIMASTQDFSESIVRSMTLFIFRTLILPLLFLFFLARGIRFVWNIDLEAIYQREKAYRKQKAVESALSEKPEKG